MEPSSQPHTVGPDVPAYPLELHAGTLDVTLAVKNDGHSRLVQLAIFHHEIMGEHQGTVVNVVVCWVLPLDEELPALPCIFEDLQHVNSTQPIGTVVTF